MPHLLDSLNPIQQDAVRHTDGPTLILAGAGSGKTRVLTHKIAYLIDQGIDPTNILAVTFTNKAAGEMKERLQQLLQRPDSLSASGGSSVHPDQIGVQRPDVPSPQGSSPAGHPAAATLREPGLLPAEVSEDERPETPDSSQSSKLETRNSKLSPTAPPWTGTFHSICAKILRRHIHHLGYSNSFVIYDTGDQTDVIKQAMDQLRIKAKEDKVNPNAVRATISSAKNELIGPTDYKRFANGYFQDKVADIYPIYQQKLRDNNALDFDDLLIKTIDLFTDMPDILNQYANQFEYIFIDEYQDTNRAQYVLIKMLAAAHRNLTVVGDMSQSIYSFRGATIANILNFEKDYPDAKVFHLEQNYRSTQNILTAATHVIMPNQKSHTILKLWTENGIGDPIIQYQALDEQDEANYVARRIKELTLGSQAARQPGSNQIKDTNPSQPDQDSKTFNLQPSTSTQLHLKDVAVLYRTNAQSRVLEEALMRAGIPYRLVGGTRFYDRKEIKDVLAYLRLCVNPTDSVAFARVANVPARGIGPATLINGGPKLDAFKRDLEIYQKAAQEMNVLELLDFILQHTKYHQYLNDGTDEGEARWENVQELRTVAAEFATAGPQESLQNFLENVALVESESHSKTSNLEPRTSQDEVTLMTLHAAKGLEFSVVFIVGMEEGIFPHSRAILDASEMQEERRLAYVGVTRAKEILHLVHAQQRALFGSRSVNQISRFIIDIPEDILTSHSSRSQSTGFGSQDWTNYGSFHPSSLSKLETQTSKLDLTQGDAVLHSVFGQGQVLNITPDTIEVEFEDSGRKKLDPTFARLIKVNGT